MSYINTILGDGEIVLAKAKVTFWIYFMIIPYFVIFAFIKRWTTEMALTNRRIIYKSGLISRNTTEISLKKVESVGVKQGVLGRILGYGQVYITGTGNNISKFDKIGSPITFKKAIDEALAKMN